MRKIVATFVTSLDEVVESPQGWHFPFLSKEMGAAIGATFAGSDPLPMGRTTYAEWLDVCPRMRGPLAAVSVSVQMTFGRRLAATCSHASHALIHTGSRSPTGIALARS